MAQRNRREEALATLALVRNNDQTEEEVLELTGKCEQRSEQAGHGMEKIKAKLSLLTSRSFLRAFLIAESLNILLSCSGLSMLLFYSGTDWGRL